MSSHPFTNFEIQTFHQKEPKFDGAGPCSKNNLSKMKDGPYIINLYEYESIETYCIAFYVNAENVTNFDSFEIEYIPKEIKKLIGNKNIKTNIFRTQANDSIMFGYFCSGIIDFMLKINRFIFSHRI